jgi:hypothetical protein
MTESATNLADLAVRPTYEQVLQSINHSEVQGLLRDARADERRLNREL